MKEKLLTQQSEAIQHLLQWKVGALFMEAGTGKTRVACELINAVPDIDYVLWVGPYNTIHRDDGTSVVVEIKKCGINCSNTDFIGIESIQGSDRIFVEILNKVKNASKPFVVVDESLNIKNLSAKRTHKLLEIGEICEYKLILNGTPLSKNILDLYAQIQFISPKILNMRYRKYKDTFCNYKTIKTQIGNKSMTREFVTGYANIDYLYSLIRHYVYDCDLKLNVTQQYTDVYYELSEDDAEAYKAIRDKFLTDEFLQFRSNKIFFEMTQMMQHAYSLTEDKFVKINRLFKDIPQSKTIIFCKYISSQEECRKRYPDALVLSYQKESYGLNLQDYRYTIYFDKVFDYALRVQSGRRTFRTGQESDCKYYDLTGNCGLEKMIDRNISKKTSMSEYFKKVSREQLIKDLK